MPLCPWESPGKNTGVDCHALLQGIFPIQGSNPGLPHCRWILYHLSYHKNNGVGSLSLLQGNFPTQELNWGLLDWGQILCQLSDPGSPNKVFLFVFSKIHRVVPPTPKKELVVNFTDKSFDVLQDFLSGICM